MANAVIEANLGGGLEQDVAVRMMTVDECKIFEGQLMKFSERMNMRCKKNRN